MMIELKCAQCLEVGCEYLRDYDDVDECCPCSGVFHRDEQKMCTNCFADYASNIYDHVKGEREKG